GLVTFTALQGMAPGDVVTAPITITNNGSLQMRYAITSQTTENALAGQLRLTVKTGVTTCDTTNFGTDGTAIYGPGILGTTTGTNVVGDPTPGGQSGDRVLNASSNEVLCFQVSLPSSTDNGFKDKSTTASFNFQ